MSLAPNTVVARRAPPVEQAQAIARALLDGFDKHYALFRECARAARRYFEAGNWLAIQHVGRDRIDFYDRRVHETAERIAREFRIALLDGSGLDTLWEQVKRHYIALLIDHKQPECAETFFNSVSVKILHRAYFHNRFIFVRPAISTEHIDADSPSLLLRGGVDLRLHVLHGGVVLLDRRVGRVLVALGQRPLVFDVLLVAFEVRVGVAPPLAFLVVGAELARMLGLVAAVGLGKDHGAGCGRGGSRGGGRLGGARARDDRQGDEKCGPLDIAVSHGKRHRRMKGKIVKPTAGGG